MPVLRSQFPLLLLAFVLSAPAAHATSKRTVLKSAARWAAIASTTGYLGIQSVDFATERFHDHTARKMGREHLGLAVYYDRARFESGLSLSIQDRIKAGIRPEDQLELAKDISVWLSGAYSNDRKGLVETPWVTVFPYARMAEEYVDGTVRSRGVCRHKAVLLSRFLNDIGIRAEIMVAFIKDTAGGHAWVSLPDHGIWLDPTNNTFNGLEPHVYLEQMRKEGVTFRSSPFVATRLPIDHLTLRDSRALWD